MRRRVVVTGMGAVTPLGNDVPATWRGLTEGRSGVAPITLFDASSFPTRIAGEVKSFAVDPSRRRFGRHSLFALGAAEEAARDSGFRGAVDPERLGIYFGAGDGGFNFPEFAAVLTASLNGGCAVKPDAWFRNSTSRLSAETLIEQEPHQVVNHLARTFGVRGAVYNSLTACAASSQAIGEAAEMIREGSADVMITGGAHSMIHPLGVAGFNLLTALSTRNDDPAGASRPFDKERDGFILAEGSGVVILEDLEHARKRGAKIYAELAGYGTTADAFRLTDPHPEGRGAIQAMRLALADAGLAPREIGYINAHGTSTQLNDQIETLSVKAVFGEAARNVPMSSIKSMLGHMIAAAGAVEFIASVLAIRDGVLPPTINYRTPDEACDLDYVPNAARKAAVDTVLSNSFGFGGQNVALVVKRFR
ncbi:MAG TPA: beta-ketoacyl-[acyl-carrier-protein] synthase family protein [Candidatus Eisenbacteria bacterium]|nr:beta-ketoacyl-[acyl-carrier-protein] synthase family protein [Candidatus Eisenbacteria bacterium]